MSNNKEQKFPLKGPGTASLKLLDTFLEVRHRTNRTAYMFLQEKLSGNLIVKINDLSITKYLEIHIGNDMRFAPHINKTVAKVN